MAYMVYLKPTNFCNVGCHHCFIPQEWLDDRNLMEIGTVARLAETWRDYIAQNDPNSTITFLMHGGEPLTVNPEWFYDAQEAIQAFLTPSQYNMGIQTSLIPYDSERHYRLIWDLFGGQIGTSLDFSNRNLKGSNERYQDVWLRKVHQAWSDGIFVGVLSTPGWPEIEAGAPSYLNWFFEHGIPNFKIEPYTDAGMNQLGSDPDRPTNAAMSQFFIDLLDYSMELLDEKGWVPVCGTLQTAINSVLTGRPGERWGGTCSSDFVVVEPNGDTNNCPNTAGHETPFSNIHSQNGFQDFMTSPQRRASIRDHKTNNHNPNCFDCPYTSFCGGGCPIIPQKGQGLYPETECSGFRTFLSHIDQLKKTHPELLKRYLNYSSGQASVNEQFAGSMQYAAFRERIANAQGRKRGQEERGEQEGQAVKA